MATVFGNQAAQDYPPHSLQQALRLHDYASQNLRQPSPRHNVSLHRDDAAVDVPGTPSPKSARTRRFEMELDATNATPVAVLLAAEVLIVSLAVLVL